MTRQWRIIQSGAAATFIHICKYKLVFRNEGSKENMISLTLIYTLAQGYNGMTGQWGINQF